MEFDASTFLMGLPIAFALGWLASRFDLRQLRMENRQAPKAYFKGLNFLLNEQQDRPSTLSSKRSKTIRIPQSCTLRWAIYSAAAVNTSVRCACISTCFPAPIFPQTTATAPNTAWRWTT
jgi:hypothetical protein